MNDLLGSVRLVGSLEQPQIRLLVLELLETHSAIYPTLPCPVWVRVNPEVHPLAPGVHPGHLGLGLTPGWKGVQSAPGFTRGTLG